MRGYLVVHPGRASISPIGKPLYNKKIALSLLSPQVFHRRENSMTTAAEKNHPEPANNPSSNVALPQPANSPKAPSKPKFHPYPWWSPRFWHGMKFGDWMKLCARHQFRINPIRWPMAVLIEMITPFNSIMGYAQSAIYGKRIAAAKIEKPPVFILGHWRSGTTYLHELLALDQRFVTPSTYQCFAPHHFLLTEWLIAKYFGFLMPKQRPMDNMAMGWDRPQEDEFALLTLGAPTPYLRMAFPNDPPPHEEMFDMEGVAPRDREKFESTLRYFVQLLTFRTGKQLLLKSPPHTGRIETLARLFPGAKFIHITRNPYNLFSSTVRLWQSLDEVQSLQWANNKGLEEYVLRCFTRMYDGFNKQRSQLDPSQIVDIKYEDLVQNPLAEIERVYADLGFENFGTLGESLASYGREQKDYQTNKHPLDAATKAKIYERWGDYFRRFGYEA